MPKHDFEAPASNRHLLPSNPELGHELESCGDGDIHLHLSFKAAMLITSALAQHISLDLEARDEGKTTSPPEMIQDGIAIYCWLVAMLGKALQSIPDPLQRETFRSFGQPLLALRNAFGEAGFNINVLEALVVEAPEDNPTPPTFQ